MICTFYWSLGHGPPTTHRLRRWLWAISNLGSFDKDWDPWDNSGLWGLGWWLIYPSEKYESVGISISNIWKNQTCSKHFQTTNQSLFCGRVELTLNPHGGVLNGGTPIAGWFLTWWDSTTIVWRWSANRIWDYPKEVTGNRWPLHPGTSMRKPLKSFLVLFLWDFPNVERQQCLFNKQEWVDAMWTTCNMIENVCVSYRYYVIYIIYIIYNIIYINNMS